MNMYYHIKNSRKILASNLPKEYESLTQSCNVESETLLHKPCNKTICHGKISQGDVEIYLLSDDSDISNEIFKIYQDVYISILPNIISCEEIKSEKWRARVMAHDMAGLVGGINSYCKEFKTGVALI